jgi:hypothetical protein
MMRIKEIFLDQAEPGMKLACDVKQTNGSCLLSAGSELSNEAIVLLNNRGVTTLQILIAVDSQQKSAEIELIEQQISKRFRKVQNDPLMAQLRKALLNHRLKELE